MITHFRWYKHQKHPKHNMDFVTIIIIRLPTCTSLDRSCFPPQCGIAQIANRMADTVSSIHRQRSCSRNPCPDHGRRQSWYGSAFCCFRSPDENSEVCHRNCPHAWPYETNIQLTSFINTETTLLLFSSRRRVVQFPQTNAIEPQMCIIFES